MQDKKLTQEESLELISKMIVRAQNSYHSSGFGPIMWGCVITVCSMATWAMVVFKFSLPFDIWLLTILAIFPQIYSSIREKKQRKMRAYEDVAMDYIWICFGFAIFLLVHVNISMYGEVARMVRTIREMGGEESFRFYDFSTAYFLILYGIPTLISGGIMRFKPMIFGGIFCWICSIACVYTPLHVDLLLTAASAIAAWLIPGLILNRSYRKQKKNHV